MKLYWTAKSIPGITQVPPRERAKVLLHAYGVGMRSVSALSILVVLLAIIMALLYTPALQPTGVILAFALAPLWFIGGGLLLRAVALGAASKSIEEQIRRYEHASASSTDD